MEKIKLLTDGSMCARHDCASWPEANIESGEAQGPGRGTKHGDIVLCTYGWALV